ncbi:uncharacterized protein [Drosophila kikkawai]|uniref:Uncharacterized protein LOC108079210 n=1 Tax=Drosophila kikkawai TaxID=30033 RepID=A0A6P4J350_DROKI|nr:uncharacterized protein LOC108079210 [Drosophila kikkawai]XP_017028968.1 uncharacterized protein LOC108079210 [Drosophila kikkawai]KAH8343499.1 hypothetical protein KR059_011718 [Drosophila kikkawai]
MSLTGLCIELRPNLRSGVVFLQFDHNIADRNETRLVIREHNVYIAAKSPGSASSTASRATFSSTASDSDSETDEEEVESLVIRHDCFGMDIGCISIFVVAGHHISFRFNYTQIDLDALDGGAVQVSMAPLLCSCRENEPISVTCRDCRATLVEERCYRRLREFPSCVVDPSEFFCHNHGVAGGCEDESKVPSLVPGEADLFYGLNYVVVSMNRDSSPSILNREDHLYCKRCMRYLGVTMFNGAAARLWADAVRWLPGRECKATATLPRHFFQSSSMTQLVKRLLYSLWPQPLPQLCLSTSRAVLVTSLPSRRRHQYMFIHVVESQLRVLRRIQPDSQQLRCYRACKLYYGVFGAGEGEQEPPLLQQWQAHQSVPQMEISPAMFQTLQERFELNTQLIPHAWRLNSVAEGLQLSYFFYEDEAQPEGVIMADDDDDDAVTRLGKKQPDDQYETDAGHASSESESDDEHSDSDEDVCHSVERRTGIKRCPTPPHHCLNLSTSTSSASSEDK